MSVDLCRLQILMANKLLYIGVITSAGLRVHQRLFHSCCIGPILSMIHVKGTVPSAIGSASEYQSISTITTYGATPSTSKKTPNQNSERTANPIIEPTNMMPRLCTETLKPPCSPKCSTTLAGMYAWKKFPIRAKGVAMQRTGTSRTNVDTTAHVASATIAATPPLYFPRIIPRLGATKAKRRYWIPGANDTGAVRRYEKPANKPATTTTNTSLEQKHALNSGEFESSTPILTATQGKESENKNVVEDDGQKIGISK